MKGGLRWAVFSRVSDTMYVVVRSMSGIYLLRLLSMHAHGLYQDLLRMIFMSSSKARILMSLHRQSRFPPASQTSFQRGTTQTLRGLGRSLTQASSPSTPSSSPAHPIKNSFHFCFRLGYYPTTATPCRTFWTPLFLSGGAFFFLLFHFSLKAVRLTA